MQDVREYNDGLDVELKQLGKRWVILAYAEAGFAQTSVDLRDIINWVKNNKPELLELENDTT